MNENNAAALPLTIRVGGIDYAVSQHKDLRDGGTWLNGHILFNECEIRVEEQLGETITWVVLWHEVLHGLLEHAGISHEEQMIVALGYGVAQALRDNPYLRQPPEKEGE